MSIFNAWRAGSGDYQAVRQLKLTVSTVNAGAWSVETYSAANSNIVTGSIADLTTDSMVVGSPDSAGGFTALSGLILVSADITATGALNLVWYNSTGGNLTPGSIQVNIIVL